MFGNLWSRVKAFFAPALRRAPIPGHFESGSKFTWRGFLAVAPLVRPSRDYLLYVPQGRSRWKRAPLVVLCHGCKQTPEEFAQGTRITDLADRMGLLVLLPRQKDNANPYRCWNWFDSRTARGSGEAAIVAAQIKSVLRSHRGDPKRVIVAGISAGGALAAVLGVRHPGLVTAVAVHSGLACGAAASSFSALNVMKRGPDGDVERIADMVRAAAGRGALPVPLLAVHGDADDVVAPRNAIALVRQYLRLNGHPAIDRASTSLTSALPPADAIARLSLDNGRTQTVHEWRVDRRLVARYVTVSGLAHGWSGGDAAFPFHDNEPPDATALLGAFIDDALS